MNGAGAPAVEIAHLVKRYGDFTAVDDISLRVEAGDFFGFLGPNGAGKTTTINAIVGLARLTQGSIRIFGQDTVRDWRAARFMVGLAPQEYNFDRYLSIRDILIYQAGYFGLRSKEVAGRADMLLEQFGLSSKARQDYTKLSGGMKRRLTLARAMIHSPKLLILDEPTAGVDVELRLELREAAAKAQPCRNDDLSHHALSGRGRAALPQPGHHPRGQTGRGATDERTAGGRGPQLARCFPGAHAMIAPRTAGVNWVALLTLMKREMVRTLKVINQVIWPPVISTVLYVTIFGLALGSRIKSVQGVSYAEFLIPGLIMLQVIDSSYGECSSSVFQGRFMNSIQEMLIAPMSAPEMVFGYILGSLARALVIANIIMVLGWYFVHTLPSNWLLYFCVMAVVSVLFSALGMIFGLMAEKFDHLAVLTTFAITPLVFVGGVFTSAQLLPPALRRAELLQSDVLYDRCVPVQLYGPKLICRWRSPWALSAD